MGFCLKISVPKIGYLRVKAMVFEKFCIRDFSGDISRKDTTSWVDYSSSIKGVGSIPLTTSKLYAYVKTGAAVVGMHARPTVVFTTLFF